MLAYYPQIKSVHVFCVLFSVALFALRGALLLSGRRSWSDLAALRYLSYSIDTVLLTSALMLYALLPAAVFGSHWLKLKLLLLLVYIVLGHLALNRARTRAAQCACLLAALGCYGWMYGIARAHHPAGWLRLLGIC
jgi:uncharacterized membrane protein SirB2